MSEVVTSQEVDTEKNKFLVFQLGVQEFALPIHYVGEIIGLQKITPLPFDADFVKGVINLRGQVIPVIDARLRLGMEERRYDDRTCIIINRTQRMLIGLIVDAVNEVVSINPEQIEKPPKIQPNQQTNFIDGLAKTGEQVKIILNMENFLFAEALTDLKSSETMERKRGN